MKLTKTLAVFTFLSFAFSTQAEIVAHWSLDGTLQDSSGNGHHGGSFVGVDGLVNQAETGRYVNDGVDGHSSSYQFNNTNYIATDLNFASDNALPSFNVSLWFKSSTPSTEYNFDNWSFLDFDRSEYFNVFLYTDGSIGFSTTSIDNSGTRILDDMISLTSGLNDGLWHQLHISYGETYGKQIYIDSVLDSANSYHGAIGTGEVRYGFIGDGSEATEYNGQRNNIYYDGQLSNITLRDNEMSLSPTGEIVQLDTQVSANDVPTPFLPALLVGFFIYLNKTNRKTCVK